MAKKKKVSKKKIVSKKKVSKKKVTKKTEACTKPVDDFKETVLGILHELNQKIHKIAKDNKTIIELLKEQAESEEEVDVIDAGEVEGEEGEEEITEDDIKEACEDYMNENGAPALKKLLKSYDAKRVRDVKEEDWADFYADLIGEQEGEGEGEGETDIGSLL
jgi:hypothetical protein